MCSCCWICFCKPVANCNARFSYTHIKMHSLFLAVDRLELELASLNMIELASLNSVVDRFVSGWNRLFMAWWTNRLEQRRWNHHDKSTAMFIHDRNMLWRNDEITILNSDVTTTMNLVDVSSRVLHVLIYANNPCRFAKLHTIICWNMIEQNCYFINPVLSC